MIYLYKKQNKKYFPAIVCNYPGYNSWPELHKNGSSRTSLNVCTITNRRDLISWCLECFSLSADVSVFVLPLSLTHEPQAVDSQSCLGIYAKTNKKAIHLRKKSYLCVIIIVFNHCVDRVWKGGVRGTM